MSSNPLIELRVSVPPEAGELEISVDGSPYRPCTFEQNAWSYRWHGSLSSEEPLVAVVRPRRNSR
jgi:hypothetical protein